MGNLKAREDGDGGKAFVYLEMVVVVVQGVSAEMHV